MKVDKRVHQAEQAISEFLKCKPGSRKSHSEFKPLIKHPDGSTEVADKAHMVRLEHRYARSRKRGAVFPTAEEAMAFAQSVIDERIAGQEEYKARIEAALANGARPMPL